MKDRTERIAGIVLAASRADETEVIVSEGVQSLTRFANNAIHQNVSEENTSVTIRVALGKRVGVAAGNDVSNAGLRRLVKTALDIAKQSIEVAEFPGLPGPKPIAEVQAFCKDTSVLTPTMRARAAAGMIKPALRKGAVASGFVANSQGAMRVANSKGVDALIRRTEYEVSAVIEKDSGAGYAGGISCAKSGVNARAVGRTALCKCIKSMDPKAVEPGEYTVILEPQALAELIAYMGYMGFGAQNFDEGTSFLCGRIDTKVAGDAVSIWDDGLDAEGMPISFDFEGVPKRKVMLIEGGVARGVVYDTLYAAKAGRESTGHALPPGYTGGPLPTNLFMAPGESSREEMIRSTERGLLVTRFHYINIADQPHAVLTGMTRDGTFLIEKGKVRRPIKNLRFTESMLKAFSNVQAISRDRSVEPSMLGGIVVPTVKIADFLFTGATAF